MVITVTLLRFCVDQVRSGDDGNVFCGVSAVVRQPQPWQGLISNVWSHTQSYKQPISIQADSTSMSVIYIYITITVSLYLYMCLRGGARIGHLQTVYDHPAIPATWMLAISPALRFSDLGFISSRIGKVLIRHRGSLGFEKLSGDMCCRPRAHRVAALWGCCSLFLWWTGPTHHAPRPHKCMTLMYITARLCVLDCFK